MSEVGFSANGRPRSGMGVDAADVNGDGRQDLFVANVDQEMFSLYQNEGKESFSDVAAFHGDAQAMLGRLGALSQEDKYVPPYPIAVIYAGLGERDQAIEWLEKAYEERDSWMNYVHLDPRLHSLRADPRFVSLVGRMRFTR